MEIPFTVEQVIIHKKNPFDKFSDKDLIQELKNRGVSTLKFMTTKRAEYPINNVEVNKSGIMKNISSFNSQVNIG